MKVKSGAILYGGAGVPVNLDKSAKDAILHAINNRPGQAALTKKEVNHLIVNGVRDTQMRRGKQNYLPTTLSTYMEKAACASMGLTDCKPEHLSDAREKATGCPESTLNWAFLCAAYGNVDPWSKSNCDGTTITLSHSD